MVPALATGCGDGNPTGQPAPSVLSLLLPVSPGIQGGVVAEPVTHPPAVMGRDQHGAPMAGVLVRFEVVFGGGSVTGGMQTTGPDGVARVGSWTLGPGLGGNVLTATAGNHVVAFTASGAPGPAAAMAAHEGDGQVAQAGTAVPVAPAVRVADAYDNPVAGVPVTFSVLSGGGSVTGAAQTTGANGIARVGSWTLGPDGGPNTLNASATPDLAVTFTATAAGTGTLPLWSCLEQVLTGEAGCAITVEPWVQGRPSISGSRVVWEDRRHGLPAIFLLDLETRRYRQVSPPDTESVLAEIEGDLIAYVRAPAPPGCPNPWRFFVYHIPSGTETLFHEVPCTVGLGRLSMSGDRVAWHEKRDDNWDIFVHDFGTGREIRVTTHPAPQADPSIHGNLVAWWDKRHDRPWADGYTWDLETGVEGRITGASTLARGPVVSAQRIVWGDISPGFIALFEYTRTDPPRVRQVPAPAVDNHLRASPSGRYVAWTNRNVHLYDFDRSVALVLSTHPAPQWYPALTEEYLVWEDHRDGYPRVYLSRLSKLRW